jgi:hypothetical protein
MALLRMAEDHEPLVAPAIVAAFDGWVDAAGASTAAAAILAEGGQPIATFDADLLFDYRARRPVLDIIDGTPSELSWPSLSIDRVATGGRDVLVFTGAEPDFRWRELGEEVLELALRVGIVEWISIGAIPAGVPHTRPTPIMATASRPGLLPEGETPGPPGTLRVPAAALSTLEMAVAGSGIPAVGFFAQVPHYVTGPYAAATIALLERVGRHLGVETPLGALPDEALAQRQRLDAAVAADADSLAYLKRLEEAADEEQQPIPSGDELAREIERFLRGQAGEGRE